MSMRQLYRQILTPQREQQAVKLYDFTWQQAAQQAPDLFGEGVPATDQVTRQQRFEVLAAFAAAVVNQLQQQGEYKLAQRFHDVLFDQIEASIRIGGVGDPSINRHMKKYIGAFQGRLQRYLPLFEAEQGNFVAALEANHAPQAGALAQAVMAVQLPRV